MKFLAKDESLSLSNKSSVFRINLQFIIMSQQNENLHSCMSDMSEIQMHEKESDTLEISLYQNSNNSNMLEILIHWNFEFIRIVMC